MSNNTTARVLRPALRTAGLETSVAQITTGKKCTYVRLVWTDDATQRDEACTAVLNVLRSLWNDGATRVRPVYSGLICITRTGWYKN